MELTSKLAIKTALALGLMAVLTFAISPVSLAESGVTATITSPSNGASYQVGETVSFEGMATGGDASYSYTWNFGDGDSAFGQSASKTYDQAGTYTITFTASDFDGLSSSDTIELTIEAPVVVTPVTATIEAPANGAVLQVGQAITFRGSATGGDPSYSYTWNFGDGSSAFGETYDKTYTEAGSRTITLMVSDFDGLSDTDTITVTVEAATNPVPTVDLKANNSDGPINLTTGQSAVLSWSTNNAAICTATGAWTGDKPLGGSGSTGDLATGNYTYTLTCTGAGGSATDAVTINVSSNPPLTSSIDLKANGSNGPLSIDNNTDLTLTWTGNNIDSCLASGDWTGSKAISGSENLGKLAVGSKTYTLTCVKGDQSTIDTVAVTITDGSNPTVLTISNVQITNVTKTSATITWTTNLAATSRVIYDTASHSSISGQTGPNYGYANSTGTTDTDPKVTSHSVTVTGLSSNTKYYFRVISES